MLKKSLAVGIILLFISSGIIPVVVSDNPISTKTIYVDDDGGADYTKIQDAIDNSSDGDTIYVYNGLYYETIDIDKEINLIGENKESTIIDGMKIEAVITSHANNVSVSGFTIRNSGNRSYHDCGIQLGDFGENQPHFNNITGNILENNTDGIYIYFSDYNEISSNIIRNNSEHGICLHSGVWYNKISNNIIRDNNGSGIYVQNSDQNQITNNLIINNADDGIIFRLSSEFNDISLNTIYGSQHGINIWGNSFGTEIYMNNITSNIIGMYIENSLTEVTQNNIYNNGINACFLQTLLYFLVYRFHIKWQRNYWGTSLGIFPKIIMGGFLIMVWISFGGYPAPFPIFLPFIMHIDLFPAREPYDIPIPEL